MTITLDGSLSFDDDGSIVSWLWTQLSGPGGATITDPTAMTTTVTGLGEGVFVFQLQVTSDDDTIDTDTTTVTIIAAPTADAGDDQSIDLPVNVVTLDGSGTGDTIAYLWSSPDPEVSFDDPTDPATQVHFSAAGIFIITLTVTDRIANEATSTMTVTLRNPDTSTAGCMNPSAVNYDPLATEEDYSCIYLKKHDGVCNKFEDVNPMDIVDRSFTLSWSITGQGWVFFHDYVPDLYFHTRDKLFLLKDNYFYEANEGSPGSFFDEDDVKPYFIDVVFSSDKDLVLETVNWVTEFLESQTEQVFRTLTHITIWNGNQHTGRIALAALDSGLHYSDKRRTQGEWSFDKFRDILKDNGGAQFLDDLFHDYALDQTQANANQPWYAKGLLQDKWFCVRFEFDNTSQQTIVLHEVNVQAKISDR